MKIQGVFWKIGSKDEVRDRLARLGDHLIDRDEYPALIKVTKDTRSDQQNRFMWGWLYRQLELRLGEAGIVIPSDDGREFPYTKKLLHDMFKETFLTYATIRRGDKERKLTWSTTKLGRSPKETDDGEIPTFSWYVEQVRQFSVQVWGIAIEDPPVQTCDYPELMRELRGEA